ncbi:MAG: FG-GAP-like repeat-containing protein [Bacteroidota bacterium]
MTSTSSDRLRLIAERAGYSFASTPAQATPRPRSKRAPRWRRWLLAGSVLFSVALPMSTPAAHAQQFGTYVDAPRSPSHPFQPPVQGTFWSGDFDGDGDVDLWGGDLVHEQIEPGVFQERARSNSVLAFTESVSGRWHVVDADSDGDTDLLLEADPSFLYRQTEPGVYEREAIEIPRGAIYVAYADFDQDGDLDALAFDQLPDAYDSAFYLVEQTAPGVFQEDPAPENIFGDLGRFSYYTSGRPTLADLDDDGDLDLAVGEFASNGTSIILQEQPGMLGPDLHDFLFVEGYAQAAPVVGDFDGDGDTDLVAFDNLTPRTYVADGPAQFSLLSPEEGPFGYLRPELPGADVVLARRAATLSDLDADGQPEVVVMVIRITTSENTRVLTVFEQGESGIYRELEPEENPLRDLVFDFERGLAAYDLDVGDVDGDGDEDLLVRGALLNPRRERMMVIEQTPTGFELRADGVYPFSDAPVGRPAFVDVDGDGDDDVILDGELVTQPGARYVYEQTAPGVFQEQAMWSAALGAIGGNQIVADFDGDGDADVHRRTPRAVFEQVVPGVFEERPEVVGAFPDLTTSFFDVTTGDVEGDGDLDIVFRARDGFDYYRNDAIVVADEPTAQVPDTPALEAAYPNPFRDAATLTLALPEAQAVRVALYDVLGREVALLHEGTAPAGPLTLRVDGRRLASGVYVVRAEGATFAATQRITHLD